MMKKIMIWLFVIVATFFLSVIVYFSRLNTSRWLKMETVAKRQVETMSFMRYIALHSSHLAEEGAEHPIEIEDILNFSDEFFPDLLKYDIQKKIIYDTWQMPITITFIEPSSYKYVSFGPNRTDDQGLKDDIVRIYNLSGDQIELVEKEI